MTTEQYQNLTPREAADAASPRLFSFARIRENATTRFYPGDGAKLHFANRDVDTLEMPGLPSGFLAAGDTVTASYGGATVFRGEVATIVETRGRGDDATQTVTCAGPWSKMQRLVYRQNWKTGANAYSYSSRLVLNQAETGLAQSLDTELTEIATLGETPCGYELGTVSVSGQCLPFDECRDITVADAIRRELRFFPKAICRFDYSAATPVFHVVRPTATASAAYVATVPKTGREYVYNAHPITGVDLEIEASGTIDGVEYHQISHQTAGNTDAGNPDCLYATLQIKGASASTTRQSFKSVTEQIPANLNDAAWWKARHPRLANVAANTITISDGARSPSTYPRISAATAGDIEAAGLHCEVSQFTCKATIATTDDKEEDVYLTLNYLTTDATGTAAQPRTYTWTVSSSGESGETVPQGLAATILAERAGTLLSERLTVRLGASLPALGDAIVEDGQAVYLQAFDVDCGTLTADLTFGVPDYLTPEDMAALLSGFRNKCTCSSQFVRKTGREADRGKSKVEMGAIKPLSSSEFAPGTKAKTTIKSAAAGGGSIKLDSAEVDAGEEIAVHEFKKITGGAETVAAKILATDDIEVTSRGIQGGNGINVSVSGSVITITNTKPCSCSGGGSGSAGVTADVTVLREVSYDTASHELSYKTKTLGFEDGILMSVDDDASSILVTTAVEETV